MSSVVPSSEVPIACMWKRTRCCFRNRRWISAMYSLALSSLRPSARTVRSAVAIGLEGYARAPPRAGYLGLRPLGVAGVLTRRLASLVEPLVAAGREPGALLARILRRCGVVLVQGPGALGGGLL